MTKYVRALLMTATGVASVGAAAAQTTSALPNYGNYKWLGRLPRRPRRLGLQRAGGGGRQPAARVEQNEIDGIIDYLDPSEISQEIGTTAAQFASITGIFDIRGANGIASYNQHAGLHRARGQSRRIDLREQEQRRDVRLHLQRHVATGVVRPVRRRRRR
ncbi:hypothetical protein AB5I41_11935 [Sphingomonas sp. MMS24-JH45]